MNRLSPPPQPRGVGVDVCQMSRIARVHARFGDRFLRRAFHPAEAARFGALLQQQAQRAAAHAFLASRWAAKEALHKALGGAPRLLFPEVEVTRGGGSTEEDPPRVPLRDLHGRVRAGGGGGGGQPPSFQFHGAAAQLMAARCGRDAAPLLLSLSHDGDYAVAFVVLGPLPATSEPAAH